MLKNLSLSGARVACIDITKPKSKLKNVHYFYCDVTNEKNVKECIKNIEKKFKKIDSLVNLASLAAPDMNKNKKIIFQRFC